MTFCRCLTFDDHVLQIIEELSTFGDHVNSSFSWKWQLPEEEDHYIHYTAPTYGVDANQTFDYAGLLVFTDANVTRVPRKSVRLHRRQCHSCAA